MIFLIRGYIPLFPISKIIETHSHFLHLSASAVQAVKPIRIVPGHSRSGHKTQTKKEYLSLRKPLRVLFFFVPGAARFFFSFKRKRNVGRKRFPLFQEEQKTPRCGVKNDFLFSIDEKRKRKKETEKEKQNIKEKTINK